MARRFSSMTSARSNTIRVFDNRPLGVVLLAGALDAARILPNQVVVSRGVEDGAKKAVRLGRLAESGALDRGGVPAAHVVSPDGDQILMTELLLDHASPQTAIAEARRRRQWPTLHEPSRQPLVEVDVQRLPSLARIERDPGDGVALDLRLQGLGFTIGLDPAFGQLPVDPPAHPVAHAAARSVVA